MSRALKIVGVYAGVFIAISIAFFLLLRSPLFSTQTVLFYRGVELLTLITVLLILAVGLYWYARGTLYIESLIAASIASIAIHVALFVVFPVTFDRSVTMYMLTTLGHAPQSASCTGYSKTALEQNFIDGYVNAEDAVGRRINEQSIIGLVTPQSECIELTARGRSFLQFANVVSTIYNLKR